MPKTPMDYSKNIINKIVCNDLNVKDCYVGHTINMTKRKCSHKSHCNNENDKAHNLKIYQIIRENGGWDNWSMLLVEKFPCKDKYEACKREREVYEELEAKMNTFRPYRTQEELKEYREEHKEELKQYNKQYREEHKEEIKQYREKYYQEHKEKIKEKVECKYCSKLLLKRNMTCHHKTCKSKSINEGNYLPSSDSSIESGEIELKNRIDNI
jgi:hypothetical protein